MSDSTFPTDQPTTVQPTDNDLDFAAGHVCDADPDVLKGMARLEALRANEDQIAEIRPTGESPNSI